jgi:hypothetical protein
MILTNAFSLNMLDMADDYEVTIERLDVMSAQTILEEGFSSAVGHADTAALFSEYLGMDVPMNRMTVELHGNMDEMIVGQYKGPRLPEGCHVLPEGASITWLLVTVVALDGKS